MAYTVLDPDPKAPSKTPLLSDSSSHLWVMVWKLFLEFCTQTLSCLPNGPTEHTAIQDMRGGCDVGITCDDYWWGIAISVAL
jgi:hypothetical protein